MATARNKAGLTAFQSKSLKALRTERAYLSRLKFPTGPGYRSEAEGRMETKRQARMIRDLDRRIKKLSGVKAIPKAKPYKSKGGKKSKAKANNRDC